MLIALLMHISTKAQEKERSLTLSECISFARGNNSDIKKAEIEEKISGKKINEVIGSGLPQITLSGDLVNNLKLPAQLIPAEIFGGEEGAYIKATFGTKYNYTFTGKVTQMIFNGSFWVGLSAAKYSNQYYKENTQYVSEDVEYNVVVAYYQTIIVQKQIQLLEQNMKLISKSLADTKLLHENGKAKEIDVDRLNVSYYNRQYQLKKAEDGLKQSYNNLKFQMGMPLEENISLSDSFIFTQDSLLVQKINNFMPVQEHAIDYNRRSDYRLLQTSLELQKLDRKNKITQYLPSISAYGSYSLQGLRSSFDLFDLGKDWLKFYSVGLQLNIPIFTGGQNISRIQQASLNIESIKEEIKKAENGINLQISNAVSKYNNAYYNTKTNQLNMNLAKKVYNVALLEYKEGVTDAASLVDSETKLREAQTNFINSLLELYIAKFDMEKANGTLTDYLNNIENK